MILIGVDGSYTRTGVAIIESKTKYKLFSITRSGDVDKIHVAMQHAFEIAAELGKIIRFYKNEHPDEEFVLGVEYPILATRSGSYLGLLSSKLDSLFRSIRGLEVYWIPSIACKSFTHTKSKTELVNWVKNSGIVETIKSSNNHDECTGVVLAEIARLARNKEYKNTTFRVLY